MAGFELHEAGAQFPGEFPGLQLAQLRAGTGKTGMS